MTETNDGYARKQKEVIKINLHSEATDPFIFKEVDFKLQGQGRPAQRMMTKLYDELQSHPRGTLRPDEVYIIRPFSKSSATGRDPVCDTALRSDVDINNTEKWRVFGEKGRVRGLNTLTGKSRSTKR